MTGIWKCVRLVWKHTFGFSHLSTSSKGATNARCISAPVHVVYSYFWVRYNPHYSNILLMSMLWVGVTNEIILGPHFFEASVNGGPCLEMLFNEWSRIWTDLVFWKPLLFNKMDPRTFLNSRSGMVNHQLSFVDRTRCNLLFCLQKARTHNTPQKKDVYDLMKIIKSPVVQLKKKTSAEFFWKINHPYSLFVQSPIVTVGKFKCAWNIII